jgi:hypothetical protein
MCFAKNKSVTSLLNDVVSSSETVEWLWSNEGGGMWKEAVVL